MKKIEKAIFAVAGSGTRLLPATAALPKEMLPIVDKPAIQLLVEEAVKAGVKEIMFVTGRTKRVIEDHFDTNAELERMLEEGKKSNLLRRVKKIPGLAHFSYVRQPRPLGDGHAILQARNFAGNDPVFVIFGDAIIDSEIPAETQMLETFDKYGDSVIGLSRVSKEEVSKFGVVDGSGPDENNNMEIRRIIEKPSYENAPSNFVAVGKYIITPDIFDVLAGMSSGNSGEIRLADAFEKVLLSGKAIYGRLLEGEWLDTGDKLGLLKANIYFGLRNPEIKDELEKYLNSLKKKKK